MNKVSITLNNIEITLTENDGNIFTDSRAVSQVFGTSDKSDHSNTMIMIRGLVKLGVLGFQETSYTDLSNRQSKMFNMNRDAFMMLANRFSTSRAIEYQMEIIKVFNKMEEALHAPKILSTKEILQIALKAEEDKEIAYLERDIAIETKAEIGNRREATAMATASIAVKKANKLKIELDQSKQYCTIKRMEMLMHGQSFKWRELKSACKDLDINPIDVFDANYGTVKAYPQAAWNEAYGLNIA